MDLKTGKLPAIHDRRTLLLSDILQELPTIPTSWDCDIPFKQVPPLSMFGNNKYGDCVIAARANQTLRFEDTEQGQTLNIFDEDVLSEYWKEGGWNGCCLSPKPDNGLVMLDSLKAWRSTGWKVGNYQYFIYAFGTVALADLEGIKAGIYLLNGLNAGVQLPKSAMAEFNSGMPWADTSGYGTDGHCIYLVGFNAIGPICITWARKQQLTWEWWEKYSDECMGIVDAADPWITNSVINSEALEVYLNSL